MTSVQGERHVLTLAMRDGLAMLLKACLYASDLDRSSWDFAVECARLRALGLDESDFRWLVCKGAVEHAHESTQPGMTCRDFRTSGGLLFDGSTCFVLTDAGRQLALDLINSNRELPVAGREQNGRAVGVEHTRVTLLCVPHWDNDRRELLFADQLVKRFRSPSQNQETVLQAFEEDDWRHRIDDPLPPVRSMDGKRLLHDTIVGLNRNQKHRLLRFAGDGTGMGINWEPVEATS